MATIRGGTVDRCDDPRHEYAVRQRGAVLSRLICGNCGDVRIEQEVDRDLRLVWSAEDYHIADLFYRQLVS